MLTKLPIVHVSSFFLPSLPNILCRSLRTFHFFEVVFVSSSSTFCHIFRLFRCFIPSLSHSRSNFRPSHRFQFSFAGVPFHFYRSTSLQLISMFFIHIYTHVFKLMALCSYFPRKDYILYSNEKILNTVPGLIS